MKKIFLVFILFGLFLTSCVEIQSPTSLHIPTLTLVNTKIPTLTFTDTPIVPTSTLIFAPTSTSTPTHTLTATIIPTSTITVPRSVKNKQYWAIVSQDRAAFWFMVNPERTEWTWYKAPEMTIEYEWGVEFPVAEYPYPTYSAQVTLSPDKKGMLPKKGSIDDLLKDCESGLWLKDRNAMLKLNLDNVVGISHFNGGILIELKDTHIISSLFLAHPKTLLFKTYSRFNVLPNRKIDVTVIYQ
jgi:hypothetical protein